MAELGTMVVCVVALDFEWGWVSQGLSGLGRKREMVGSTTQTSLQHQYQELVLGCPFSIVDLAVLLLRLLTFGFILHLLQVLCSIVVFVPLF